MQRLLGPHRVSSRDASVVAAAREEILRVCRPDGVANASHYKMVEILGPDGVGSQDPSVFATAMEELVMVSCLARHAAPTAVAPCSSRCTFCGRALLVSLRLSWSCLARLAAPIAVVHSALQLHSRRCSRILKSALHSALQLKVSVATQVGHALHQVGSQVGPASPLYRSRLFSWRRATQSPCCNSIIIITQRLIVFKKTTATKAF